MIQYGTQATGPARRPHTRAPAPSPSDLVAENARLRRETDHLRMERDILKSRAHVGFAGLRLHTLKTERVRHRIYATHAEARCDLFGYFSPAEMERRAA